MEVSKDEFVVRYSRALSVGDAALFIGAGLSRPAGMPDWRELLREIAANLKLDIDRETDLVAVAQFHVNEKQNRAHLNDAILESFARNAVITENHRILARLPIVAIWTTNYDQLIEAAIKEADKMPDVKRTPANLAQTRPMRDVVVYKMHGDIDQPQEAVITKDDYENYDSTHRLFTESLKGDLVSKTFLFLGFSFTDPNIDYVLSRIRVLLGQNQRAHYCVMRRPQPVKGGGSKRADYEYDRRKLDLRIGDLRRFGIETILIDEFSEVTELLRTLSRRAHQKNIFVSGSAREFGDFGEGRLLGLARRIGGEIIARGYNLVSGFGKGLGDQVILGALDGLYHIEKGSESQRLVIRPFPGASGADEQATTNKRHREDLISQSGVVLFLCGNRDYNGQIGNSKGLLEEYALTKQLGRFSIPLGCTGYAAEEIWKDVHGRFDELFPMKSNKPHFKVLGDPRKTDDELIRALFSIADKVTNWEQ